MNTDDMTRALMAHKQRDGYTSKIYKAEADRLRTEAISADISNRVKQLRAVENGGKVNFGDFEDVKERTYRYLEACAGAAAFPSVMGLASVGFGVSRQALNKFILNHPDAIVTEFLLETKDLIADVLTNAALQRNADAASVIFQLKNHYGHVDSVVLEPVAAEPLGTTPDPRQLEERISGSVVVDD